MTMPHIVSKTMRDVVIQADDHTDFIMGIMIWDEFQKPIPSQIPSVQQKIDLIEYLQNCPKINHENQYLDTF